MDEILAFVRTMRLVCEDEHSNPVWFDELESRLEIAKKTIPEPLHAHIDRDQRHLFQSSKPAEQAL